MKLYDYDPETGRINRVMTYPNSCVKEIITLIPDAIYCADGHEGDDLTHYVKDGEVVPRPEQSIQLEGMMLKGASNTATVTIEGVVYNCDGSNIELSFVRPGNYTVTVKDWPYSDWSAQIEVSA